MSVQSLAEIYIHITDAQGQSLVRLNRFGVYGLRDSSLKRLLLSRSKGATVRLSHCLVKKDWAHVVNGLKCMMKLKFEGTLCGEMPRTNEAHSTA